jgi:protein SCO1/2
MKLRQYIPLFLAAALAVHADTGASSPTVRGPHKQPVPDLLNMKGPDRPTPLKNVTIEQRLNAQIPLDTTFRDEYGHSVQLSSYFGKRPVVLALIYYQCPMLCTQILNGITRAARVMTLEPGKDYDVVAISFDAREGPADASAKKAVYMKEIGQPQAPRAWHFLTGDVDNIKRVTDAVGFRYVWDAHTAQFAHASAVYILTPQGKISKYFYGVDYSARDLRFGLIEASSNKIGTPVDQILLFCYHFDPHSAKYTPVALGILRLAGAATLFMLGGFVVIMLRRESRQKGGRSV